MSSVSCANPLFLVLATVTFLSHSWTSDILCALTGEQRPQRGGSSGGKVKRGVVPPSFDGLDALFEQTEAAEPDWKIITLQLSENPSAPVTFTLDRGNEFRPDLCSALVQQRETGKVLSHETYADMGSAQSARVWIRWLHTGEAGGLAGQTLAGVASLAACFLGIPAGCWAGAGSGRGTNGGAMRIDKPCIAIPNRQAHARLRQSVYVSS